MQPNAVIRLLVQLFALFSFGLWGYLAWPFPFPSLFFIVGTPLFAAVVWALFRSQKAILPLDPVGRALVEIFILGSAVATWFMLSYPIIGSAFAVVALFSGIVYARAEMRRGGRR